MFLFVSVTKNKAKKVYNKSLFGKNLFTLIKVIEIIIYFNESDPDQRQQNKKERSDSSTTPMR